MARLDLQKPPSRGHVRSSKRKYQRGYAVLPHSIWGDDLSTVTSINPATAAVGASGTITVTGTGFNTTSVVYFDGDARPTTYVSPTSITFTYATLVAPARTTHVKVNTGGITTFVITATAVQDAPTSSNTKEQILTWLGEHGVNINDTAVTSLTKDELLQIVALVVNGDTDPVGTFESGRTA